MSKKYNIQFRPEAQDELRAIPKPMAMRILRKLTELEQDPYGYDTTALVGNPTRRRLRVGTYRVIYTIDQGKLIIWVVHVATRATVYDHQ
jgi:mRNA interferase RelE/StbE